MAVRAPRIIQRKARSSPYDIPARTRGAVEAPLASSDELDDVLGDANLLVQNGVMMRVESPQKAAGKVIRSLISESGPYEIEAYHSKSNRRLISVEDRTGIHFDPLEPYTETRLPGVADEVESYPCRHCKDKVFLTAFGLEKHTQEDHKDHLQEVLQQIRIIRDEWRRRDVERVKLREKMSAIKYRQDVVVAAATRQYRERQREGEYGYIIASDVDLDDPYDDVMFGGIGGPFQACNICNVQINTSHPTALEGHMKAHKKNHELKEFLLNSYSAEYVESRLTCVECHLVFSDEKKLHQHTESMHVRRRKYVCKWCGHVCPSVTDLNEHKMEVHGMPPTGRPPLTSLARRAINARMDDNRDGGATHRVAPAKLSRTDTTPPEEVPVKTQCSECRLQLTRPSLLLRHMLRVHSMVTFSATIHTKGMPPFKVEVDRGRVMWICCGRQYPDRLSFGAHRRQQHHARLTEQLAEAEKLRQEALALANAHEVEVETTPEEVRRRAFNISEAESVEGGQIITGMDGQPIQVVFPGGSRSDEGVYWLVVDGDGEGGENSRVIKLDPNDPFMSHHEVEELESQEAVEEVPGPSHQEEEEDAGPSEGQPMYMEGGQVLNLPMDGITPEFMENLRAQYGDNVQILYMSDGEMEGENDYVREEEEVEEGEKHAKNLIQ